MRIRATSVSAALAASGSLLALASAWQHGGHVWRLLDAERATYAALSPAQRRQEPVTALGIPAGGAIFDFYADRILPGDRIYFQVPQGGFSANLTLPEAIASLGRFYLLPGVETTSLARRDRRRQLVRRPLAPPRQVPHPGPGGRPADLRLADPGAVSAHIGELVAANVLMAVLGCGLLPLLGLARSRRELLTRLPLGYAVGLAATGIASADLAVVHVPVGRLLLALLAGLSLFAGLERLGPGGGPRLRLPRPSELPALVVLGVVAAFAVPAAGLFAVKPLFEYDGWSIWALRARALYDFGYPVAPVFTSQTYIALQHPLLLPSLEALDFRFIGGFDGTVVHLQLLGVAVAFVGGAWCLLRGSVRPFLLASILLAVVTAAPFFDQLQTNYADMPLAMFVSLGVAALAAWLQTGAPGLLPAAALFLAAGALTKNEGEVFAVAAFVVAGAVSRRGQRRGLAAAAAAVVAADLPWRIWVAANNVKIAEYSLSNLVNPSYLSAHANRLWPSVNELWTQITSGSWGYIPWLAPGALAAALLLGRPRLALFGAGWLALSFAGLVAIYWISTNQVASNLDNSSDRTIDSLMLGAGLLVPVMLLGPGRPAPSAPLPPPGEP